MFKLTEVVPFVVRCDSQGDVDYYWSKLSAGGSEVQCGWLKDEFGLSWQVVPKQLVELLCDPDPATSKRVMEAMMQMTKIDIPALKKAAGA